MLSMSEFLNEKVNELETKRYRYLNCKKRELDNTDIQHLVTLLEGKHIHHINLSHCHIGCSGLNILLPILKSSRVAHLNLAGNKLGDQGVKCLSSILKDTFITSLKLKKNNIGCDGVKHFAEVLKDSKIVELSLESNTISDIGAKYLSEAIKTSKIIKLNLEKNKIGTVGAKLLNAALKISKVKTFSLEVNFTYANRTFVGLVQNSSCGLQDVEIKLRTNFIGECGAQYINDTYKTTGITWLNLYDNANLTESDVANLRQAFTGVKICRYKMSSRHLAQIIGVNLLKRIFKHSKIISLNVDGGVTIYARGAELIAQILKKVKIVHLDLTRSYIKDEGMRFLAPALVSSGVMYISLERNLIGSKGVKYLSEILNKSNLLLINLSTNIIDSEGAKSLVNGLKDSQVTHVILNNCSIQFLEYQHICNVIDNTICVDMDDLRRLTIATKNVSAGFKILNLFNKLVKEEPSTSYTFVIPTKDSFFSIEEYPLLIKTLIDNPKSKLHIIHGLCHTQQGDFMDFDIQKKSKINKFVNAITREFLTFFSARIKDLYQVYNNSEYFVCLVKKAEEMGLSDVIKGLIVHRDVYLIDDGDVRKYSDAGVAGPSVEEDYKKFLHPYIYLMLDKYFKLSSDNLCKPNKKEDIIAYFQNNTAIDGAQDLIFLLGSKN